jgi:type IX secretion system PorP/SprF family membrane protein
MKRVFQISTLLLFCFSLRAQQTQFSQFFASSAYLNPGFIGLEPTLTANLNHKFEVGQDEGALQELSHISVIVPIHKVTSFVSQSAGVGGTVVKESSGYEGMYETLVAMVGGAYVVRFDYEGRKLLSFGLQGGIVQNTLNFDDFQYGSQYNPYIGYDNTLAGENLGSFNRVAPVFNYGMVYSYTDHHNPLIGQNSYSLGMSFHNLNRPKTGFVSNTSTRMQFKLIATTRFKLGTHYFIHPSAYFLARKGAHQSNLGVYLSRYVGNRLSTMLQTGVWYRQSDSFIFLIGIQHNTWKAGVSLDLNSKAINQNEVSNSQSFDPTFEVSFGYSLSVKEKLIRATNPLF